MDAFAFPFLAFCLYLMVNNRLWWEPRKMTCIEMFRLESNPCFVLFLSWTHIIQKIPGVVAGGKEGEGSRSLNFGSQLGKVCVILGWGCLHLAQGTIHVVNGGHWGKTFSSVITCKRVFPTAEAFGLRQWMRRDMCRQRAGTSFFFSVQLVWCQTRQAAAQQLVDVGLI